MLQRIKIIILLILSRLRKKILGKYSIGIIYETKNGILTAPIEDLAIGRNLGFKGQWDITEVNELIQKINKKDIVYIIGGHVGTLLIPIAQKGIKVIAYEANPNTFRYLKWNIQFNELNEVVLFNYAIGDVHKKIEFYMNKVNSGGSKIKPITDNFIYTYDNPNIIKVDMLSLDDHIKSNNLLKPDCVIMDIEGAEYFALKGMKESLKSIKLLYIEYIPHHLKNVSNVSNQEFLELIVPFFNTAKFLRKKKQFDLPNDYEELIKYLDELSIKDKGDDILFTKTFPNETQNAVLHNR